MTRAGSEGRPTWLPKKPMGYVCPLCGNVCKRLAEFRVNYLGWDDFDGKIKMNEWQTTYLCGSCCERLNNGADEYGWLDIKATGRILPEPDPLGIIIR